MTRLMTVAVLALLCMQCALAAPVKDRTAFALDVLKRYAPSGYDVIEQYDSTPWSFKLSDRSITMTRADFMTFVRGSSELEIVFDLVTAVHECCHNYSRKMPWYYFSRAHEKWREAIALPIAKGETIIVPLTLNFPAREIADRIPASLRDMRFRVYVDTPSTSQTTQLMGVYGLLDEFDAYLQGTRTGVDLEGWYAREAPPTAPLPNSGPGAVGSPWLAWMQSIEPIYPARAQFKLFILVWLTVARERHPDAFRAFMSNPVALRAFVKIDDAFDATIRRYLADRAALLKRLRAQGLTVAETDDAIRIGDRGTGSGTPSYRAALAELAKYAALEREIRKAARASRNDEDPASSRSKIPLEAI